MVPPLLLTLLRDATRCRPATGSASSDAAFRVKES